MNFRITELFAFVAVDESGNEGVTGFMAPNGQWLPMVGADQARVDSLRHVAAQIARDTGKEIRLLRFSVREGTRGHQVRKAKVCLENEKPGFRALAHLQLARLRFSAAEERLRRISWSHPKRKRAARGELLLANRVVTRAIRAMERLP